MDIETMKQRIETMSKTQHIEVLKLLHSFSAVKLNENKSGVYVNLSFLPEEALEQLTKYVSYVDEQEKSLTMVENTKKDFIRTFFDEPRLQA
jgi:hypothetical protein